MGFRSLRLFVFLIVVFVAISLRADETDSFRLVPYPKKIEAAPERFSFKEPTLELRLSEKNRDPLEKMLVDELQRAGFPAPKVVVTDFGQSMLTLAKQGANLPQPTLTKEAGEGKSDPGEAYAIIVTPDGIICRGNADSGLFYAVQTLRQLIRANADADGRIPCMKIDDWPSMKYRCFQDDLTRGPSPHLETLLFESDLGAQLKQNMFTYYMEDQFEFKKHPKISPPNGSLLQDELKKWVDFALIRHQAILGNQQSFGHHHKTLRIPEYAHLGETGVGTSPFARNAPYILSPTVEEVYTFLGDLYSEIIPLVPFEMFNVCCDETFDLAKSGPSKELADEIGVGGVYVKHILRVRDLLKKYDKRMMMWGDIILKHPDKLPLIPKDVVMMCWSYAPQPSFDYMIVPFREAGYDFFVCPGTSNWNVMLPQFKRSTINIRNMVRDGSKNGAIGMLNTDWKDDGEAVRGYAWYGIAWGAECSWNASKTDPEDFQKRLGSVLFGAKGDEFGKTIELLSELQVSPALVSPGNRRFWEKDFLPRSHPEGIERSGQKILELVRPAIEYLEKTKKDATINAELLDSFLLGARRMELIATRMLDGLDVSNRYNNLLTLDLAEPKNVKRVIDELETIDKIVQKNRQAHTAIKTEFARIWNSESKPYALDRIMKKYDDYDAWFVELQEKFSSVAQAFKENKPGAELPDLDLQGLFRKTMPNRVAQDRLLEGATWMSPASPFRQGIVIEAGEFDRYGLPVELDLSVPEQYRNKKVEAFVIQNNGQAKQIPAQLDPSSYEGKSTLVFLLPELAKGSIASVHIYFGLNEARSIAGAVTTTETGPGEWKTVENDKIQLVIGPEGAHVYRWLLKDRDLRDLTNPGDKDYNGFSVHGMTERSAKFDLVRLNSGPAMVRYGCYRSGELRKTLSVYAGQTILDVMMVYPTNYYWDFDNASNFAADGETPGTFLFSNGTTGPTAPRGNSMDLQTRGKGSYWGIKFNASGIALGMVTPEEPSNFVIGPGSSMGGVGVEGTSNPRSHFVTFAGSLEGAPEQTMNRLKETFSLKCQPRVILYKPQNAR